MSEQADPALRLAEVEAALAGEKALRAALPPDQADRLIAGLLAQRETLKALLASGGGAVANGAGAVAAGAGGMAAGGNIIITNPAPPRAGPSEVSLREAYLRHVLVETGFLNLTGVDPAVANEGKARLSLQTVYTALLTRSPGERSEPLEPGRESRPVSALEQLNTHSRLVLLGDPGSGKSTFVNFVALCMAGEILDRPEANLKVLTSPLPGGDGESGEDPQSWTHGRLFPVRVVLRDFAVRGLPPPGERAAAEDLWRFLERELGRAGLAEVFPELRKELVEGRGVVLLDGLDEVPEAERRRPQIRQAIEGFAGCLGESRVLVTSRTYAYQNPQWRVRGFEEAVLAPFSRGQIDLFVGLWYEQMAAQGRLTEAEARGRATLLRRVIFASDRLLDLAERPLLLTLMASLHAWKSGILPERREELYAEAVELLLNTWERRRLDLDEAGTPVLVPASLAEWLKVDREEVRQALDAVAFEAHSAQPGLKDTADIEEGKLVARLLHLSRNPDADARQLVAYLRDRAGLLVERGAGIYTFPHRTFQEYLAACHLTSRNFPKEAARLGREDPERWREVVLLAGAKAARGAESSVWHLADKLCFREAAGGGTVQDEWGALLAGQALAESANLSQVDEDDEPKLGRVRCWLVRLLRSEVFPVRERAAAGKALAALGDPRFDAERWYLPREAMLGFVEVPAGPFLMGSDEKVDPGSFRDEVPQHEVTLPVFWMARFPVMVGQFRSFVAASDYVPAEASSLEGPANLPVSSVTWHDALAYCRWLTERLRDLAGQMPEQGGPWADVMAGRLRVSLASEAEWEKAARGTDGRIYPWGSEADPNRSNYDAVGLFEASAVGAFSGGRSLFGCEEMSGNVWEWTRSEKGPYPYKAEDGRESLEISAKSLRVLRGGAFDDPAGGVRCAYRNWDFPDYRGVSLGFRVVLSPFPL
ncbi:MAG TPA: SUMF1/EgtB/PvdO family nonheme iron enzyme [Thermoanaerobaculia bacterium]|nr:SUMF1/EgtB/PvdO family nonheme iron enzyme [Thermoanaerobaculia bacterium]